MRRFIITTLRTGIPFGIAMGVFYVPFAGWQIGLPLAVASAFLFGTGVAAFTGYLNRARARRMLVSYATWVEVKWEKQNRDFSNFAIIPVYCRYARAGPSGVGKQIEAAAGAGVN